MKSKSEGVMSSYQDHDAKKGGIAASRWNFLNRMRLWQKFLLLGVLALVSVAVPYNEFLRTSEGGVEFTDTELNGIEPVRTTVKMMQLMQQHRVLSGLALAASAAPSQPA